MNNPTDNTLFGGESPWDGIERIMGGGIQGVTRLFIPPMSTTGDSRLDWILYEQRSLQGAIGAMIASLLYEHNHWCDRFIIMSVDMQFAVCTYG